MFKHFVAIIIFLLLLPVNLYSMESVNVLVLPFEVYSQENISYLKEKISEALSSHLEKSGAVILKPETKYIKDGLSEFYKKNAEEIRSAGIKNGADYVVWGSLTLAGSNFSLDVKMIKSFSQTSPEVFFANGDGIENLPGIVRKIAEDINLKLFKKERVSKVIISGNTRIEADAIKKNIKTKPGDIFLAKSLSEDLKAIYAMGYFEDIRIEADNSPDGKIITFIVKEKQTIKEIRIKGNKVYETTEIEEALDIKTGSIVNIFKIRSNIKRIKELYITKNYHNAEITYKIHPLQHNQADLEFIIKEGGKLRIKNIIFEGNSDYSDKKLKKVIKTKEKGFLSWITSAGNYNREKLNQDAAFLFGFYHNSGYANARVGEPLVEFKKNSIEVTFKIHEGKRFKVGRVDLSGDLIFKKEKLMKDLKITGKEYYNREVIRSDMLAVTDVYSDEGYAFADISPDISENQENETVDITYKVNKGKQVYFEKITIRGNTKTRDKVIRRELKVCEQDIFSGKRLKQGVRDLKRLDYFEDVKVDTSKGSGDDKMNLDLEVIEKPTGSFSFGGGYSSVERVFVTGSITQRNLFGRGHILNLKAQLGDRSNQYTLSLTEPWLFDIPLSVGFDIYNWEYDYDDYERDSIGGSFRISYPVFAYTRLYLSYSYDKSDIKSIWFYAASSIKELEGENTTSSISTSLRYDSRDNVMTPTQGANHSITMEYAGIGGNIEFTKYLAELGWYIPLFWKTVGFVHSEGGYIYEGDSIVPDYERFYMGGMNSLRGFDWRDICLQDENGADIGGYKYVQLNFEFLFPIVESAGLKGVLFFDAGNIFDKSDSIKFNDLRESAGYGIRWFSPMGPIRLECGHILDQKEGESKSRWEFSMGTAF